MNFILGTSVTLVVTLLLNVHTKNTGDNFNITNKDESQKSFYEVKMDRMEALPNKSRNYPFPVEKYKKCSIFK